MGLGCVIEKRRQQWLGEIEAMKADMGCLIPGKAASSLRVEEALTWQAFCQSPAEAANQDERLTTLAAAAS